VRTVQAWLRLLEDGCLVTVLPPRRATQKNGRMRGAQQLRARPRVYPSDHGMVPAFAPFLDPMSRPDVRGKVLEAAVLRHLRGVRDVRADFELSFYREGEQHDLDFVIDFHDRSLGVETTMSRDPRKDLAKKGTAAERAGVDSLVIVHGGSEDTRIDKLRLVPFDKFLRDPESFIYEAKP
jgi:predicted AAA+ superfamily ATPase